MNFAFSFAAPSSLSCCAAGLWRYGERKPRGGRSHRWRLPQLALVFQVLRAKKVPTTSTFARVATIGSNPYGRGLRGLILAIAGRTAEAKTILNDLKKGATLKSTALICLAETYSLGEQDEALEFLEAAYQQRVSVLVFLGIMPTFSNIRRNPRYAELLRRMGLPEVLNSG